LTDLDGNGLTQHHRHEPQGVNSSPWRDYTTRPDRVRHNASVWRHGRSLKRASPSTLQEGLRRLGGDLR
jgi:hypothetical protein